MAQAAESSLPVEKVTVTADRPKTPAPTIDSALSHVAEDTAAARAEIPQYKASVSDLTKSFHDELGRLKSEAPKPPEIEPFKEPERVNPLSAFGSSAGLLAGLASLFTRTPLTTSLNSLSAGMQAINEGNAAAYKRAYNEWETNTQYAFKTYDAQSKAYNQLIDLAKTDYDSAMTGIKNLAAMTQDQATMSAAELRGIEGVEQLHAERERLAQQAQVNAYKVGIPAKIFDSSLNEFRMKNGREPNAQEMSQMYQRSLAGTGSTGGVMSMADLIAHYRMPMPQGYSLARMGGDQLVEAIKQINPTYNAQRYNAMNKSFQDFTSGKRSMLITAGNVAIQHLGLLRDAFGALKNNNIQAFNAAKQRWEQEMGSPLPTNFDAVAGVAADELTKFIIGGGRAGGALADREQMKETISRKMSQGQGEGVLGMYIGLMSGQMNGQRHIYDAIGLNQIQPFDDFLLPETQEALARHPGISLAPEDASTASGSKSSGGEKFIEGHVYQDANGNTARYENGKFIPVQ